jgi:hypothetical protein
MLTAIVVDDTGSLAVLTDKVDSLLDHTLVADVRVISTAAAPDTFVGGSWVQGTSLIAALEEAISTTPSKRILIISSALAFQSIDLPCLVGEIETTPAIEHLCAIPITEKGPLDLPDLTPENFIATIRNTDIWPFLCVATTRAACRTAIGAGTESIPEFITQALIRAVADGDAVRASSAITAAVPSNIAEALGELSPAAKARCLTAAVDAMNIEELYPNHPWIDFSKESAAAAYHSLAALFLRYGDADAALQSLGCSELLEESPRYFALKGLIQEARGEILDAVANMVTSLQCYEARKVPSEKHYLSFEPRDLEIINSRLVDGLTALNTRDNELAIASFSEAVFNFDGFYAEHGVQQAGKPTKDS